MESGAVCILGIPTVQGQLQVCEELEVPGSQSFTRIEMFGDVHMILQENHHLREIQVAKLPIFSNCSTASCPASCSNLLQQKSLTTRTACASRGAGVCAPLEA